ncbi:JmjC domain-containing protein, partial [Pseudomonas aeruginosa]|uniref:JmjC domain-containing protein n=1 Tax=Pseudomonas aeruginosa TaxID=287 RepID=UPI003D34D6F7
MGVLHPQRWSDKLWTLLSNLENFWQSPTGCNAYWTPPNSQGFAPHWDDIDAFVLQLEGTKRWRLYPSRDESEKFPRFS